MYKISPFTTAIIFGIAIAVCSLTYVLTFR